jgi:Pentapeptide repeats (9 copies)
MGHKSETSGPSREVTVLESEHLPEVPNVARLTVSHRKILKAVWKNRDFKDFNALATEFVECDFRYSNFERAYFRDAKFVNCLFDGAKFNDCNFKSANFYGCDLKFVQFHRCILEVSDIVASLPPQPNIRQEALKNLRANAMEMGDYGVQSLLILQEIEASKSHYRHALYGSDTYYKKNTAAFCPS